MRFSDHAEFWARRRRIDDAERTKHAGAGLGVEIPWDGEELRKVWPSLTPEQRRAFLDSRTEDPAWRGLFEKIEELERRGR